MRAWSLVINDRDGLCTEAKRQTDSLQESNTTINVRTFGPFEIEKLWRLNLSIEQLGDLFGILFDVDGARTMRLTFEAIGSVVNELSGVTPIATLGGLPIPAADKAEHNCLDAEIRDFIRRGDQWASKVEQYFRATGRVEAGERLSAQLTSAYRDMKDAGYDSTRIFFELIDMCGGLNRPAPQRVAVLAILSYYYFQLV